MKQLLIVKKTPAYAYNVSSGNDLNALDNGAIGFFKLSDGSKITGAPTENFCIALGRGSNSPAFVIPEVDVNSLFIVKASYSVGAAYSGTITIPTIAAGNTYTIILVKTGAVPHERNTWTATETVPFGDTSATAASVAAKLRSTFASMADNGLPITVSGSGANVIITGKNVGDGWLLKGADDIQNVSATSVTLSKPTIGDKAYIKDLASRCAAGKGFTDTYNDGDTIYPGYPEEVEDKHYTVYTLRFQVGRASAKTRDEKVWQVVHIAVPEDATSFSAIDAVLSPSASDSDDNG